LTVIVNCLVAVFPLVSAASHVTFVRPTLKTLPERGEHVTGREPSIASCAVTV
jgi:hypothetical protein